MLGYRADVARDGLEALEALSRGSYAAVLMDVQMPGMDGYAATAEIRRREEGEGQRTPIIAMTANALRGDREKAIEAGMDDYIAKPVTSGELRKVLERWVPRHKAMEEDAREADVVPAAGARVGREDPLDESVLVDLRKVGPEFFAGLIQIFLRDTPPRLVALDEALDSGDWDTVRGTGHALKGSCSAVGSPRMAQICGDLREAGETEDATRAEELLRGLEEEFSRVRPALESHLETG